MNKNRWPDVLLTIVYLITFAIISMHFHNPWFLVAGVLIPMVMT